MVYHSSVHLTRRLKMPEKTTYVEIGGYMYKLMAILCLDLLGLGVVLAFIQHPSVYCPVPIATGR